MSWEPGAPEDIFWRVQEAPQNPLENEASWDNIFGFLVIRIPNEKAPKSYPKRPHFRKVLGGFLGPPKHVPRRPRAPKTLSKMESNLDPEKLIYSSQVGLRFGTLLTYYIRRLGGAKGALRRGVVLGTP